MHTALQKWMYVTGSGGYLIHSCEMKELSLEEGLNNWSIFMEFRRMEVDLIWMYNI